jgi:hypothetical protein
MKSQEINFDILVLQTSIIYCQFLRTFYCKVPDSFAGHSIGDLCSTVWHYDRLFFEHSGITLPVIILLRLHVHISVKRGMHSGALDTAVSRRHNLIPLPKIKIKKS